MDASYLCVKNYFNKQISYFNVLPEDIVGNDYFCAQDMLIISVISCTPVFTEYDAFHLTFYIAFVYFHFVCCTS